MKKIILSALAVFAFAFTNAQEVKYGVKVGANVSSLRTDLAEVGVLRFNSLVGLQAGAFAEIKVASKFAVQPEVLFSMEGSEFGIEGDDAKINLSYINVPVMAKYYASEKISLQVGPQVGFLVAGKAKSEGESQDIKDDLNTVNFGVNFGLGYDITKNILVDFRYNLGLSEISKDEIMGGELKGSAFSLAVGYKF